MNKLFTIFIAILLLLSTSLFAQDITLYNSDNSDLYFNSIYCIDFDLDNGVWFGGQQDASTGLARVSTLGSDLSTWTIWDPADLALTNLEERVFYMANDDENTMWFCTHYGVSFRKSDGTSGAVDFTVDKYTRTVETDSKGNVYISIRESDRSLSKIWFTEDHGATWDTLGLATMDFNLGPADARPEIYDLREDSQGQMWICTYYGVTFKDADGNWNLIDETEDLYTYAMTVDPSDHVWVPISGANELYEIKPDLSVVVHDASSIDILSNPINDIEADENGYIWLATDGAGLVKLNPADGTYTQWDSTSTEGAIPQDNLTHMEFKDGVIWVSTESEGILKIDGALETAIEAPVNGKLTDFVLHNNYPNPFNPSTTIRFDLASASQVSLSIYNVQGQLIKSLVQKNLNAGLHQYHWDGTDYNGRRMASGIYMYTLSADNFSQSKKMVMIK